MKKFIIILSASLLFCPILVGQTVNTGKLYVSPGTEFSTLSDFENTSTGSLFNDGITYFYGNFNNNGQVDYYQEQGQIQFIGFAPQLITGQGDTYFSNILFDNESSNTPFLLEATINVETEVDFSDGIIDNRNYGGSFIFGETAKHKGASNNSHVNGQVVKLGNADFEFPIGHHGYYRMSGVSGEQTISPAYRATYFLKNPDPDFPLLSRPEVIKKINDAEYWKIEPVDSNTELVVTLSWNEATTPDFLLENPKALHIVRWDEQQQLWIDEGGVVDEGNRSVSAAVSSFGIFTLATVETGGVVLPCQMAIYNGMSPDGDGMNDYFRIDLPNTPCGDNMENLHVQIYNRWGVKVFETDDYGKRGNIFKGYSNGRLTVDQNEQLPSGTYFYIINFDYIEGTDNPQRFKKAGYLYLSGN